MDPDATPIRTGARSARATLIRNTTWRPPASRHTGGGIANDVHAITARKPTEWSPPNTVLDYGIDRATGATALVCLRGSGSRPQTA
jgi:hypothetical protein